MPPLFQRIEHDDTQARQVQHILHKTVGQRHIGKLCNEVGPDVVVAKTHMHRKTAHAERIGEAFVTCRVAMLGQVASGQQQVGAVRTLAQMSQNLIEPLAVEFDRIVRVEAQMDVGNLCDQQSNGPPLSRRFPRPR
jgi:hypothetical protein